MSQLKKAERQALLTALTAWPLPITSHEGYKKAEVTGGGVPLEQVDCKTMESRVSGTDTWRICTLCLSASHSAG
jgi:predicted flavoprotein YhiN